jgi:hypothetical protein
VVRCGANPADNQCEQNDRSTPPPLGAEVLIRWAALVVLEAVPTGVGSSLGPVSPDMISPFSSLTPGKPYRLHNVNATNSCIVAAVLHPPVVPGSAGR